MLYVEIKIFRDSLDNVVWNGAGLADTPMHLNVAFDPIILDGHEIPGKTVLALEGFDYIPAVKSIKV